jgi:hypothetical protein
VFTSSIAVYGSSKPFGAIVILKNLPPAWRSVCAWDAAAKLNAGQMSLAGTATMLLFKKQFLPAIRRGEKTQTIRLWKCRHMKAGQRSYIPGAGHIRIIAVDEVRLEELTDADALPDGFSTAEQLRAEIARLYPVDAGGQYRAFRVAFELVTE